MSSSLIKPKKRGITKNKLNDKQWLFVHAYLAQNEMNASKAAECAGYAKNMGPKLLAHPNISKAIGHALYKRAQKFELTAERVLEEITALALQNPKNLLDPETGMMLDIVDLPDNVAASIRNISVTTDTHGNTTTHIDFWDKFSALQLLYRHVGLDVDANPESKEEEARLAASKLLQVLMEKAQDVQAKILDTKTIESLA